MSKAVQPTQQQGQFPPQIINQVPAQNQQYQQQNVRMQQNNQQTQIAYYVESMINKLNLYKEECKQKKIPNYEQKIREQVKKHLQLNDKGMFNNDKRREDYKKLLSLSPNELLGYIQTLTKFHLDKKDDIQLNIDKNIELLKFLQQYKTNNPQQNFQERESSQQQVASNYNPNDDSFDQIVYEVSKEIKNQNQYQPNQYQEIEQEPYFYQNNEQPNNENEILDRNIEYDNLGEYGYR